MSNLKKHKSVKVKNRVIQQEELLNDIEKLKESNESKDEALANLQNIVKEKDEYFLALKRELLEDILLLKKSNKELKTQQEHELQSKDEALENLQNIVKEKNEHLISHLKEIESLKTQIDEIVEDLVSIKESKCWIYTKPLRDLQKAIRRDDV